MTIREQAILLCDVAASFTYPPVCSEDLALPLDVDGRAVDLAEDAHDHVILTETAYIALPPESRDRCRWAEAGVQLREGWSR